MTMLIEALTISALIISPILALKEKDPRYFVGALGGLLAALWIEPDGVDRGWWVWKNIAAPLDYPIFRVQIAVYIMYAFTGIIVVVLTKYLIRLRAKSERMDEYAGCITISAGVACLIASLYTDMHHLFGLTLMMAGVLMLVRDTVIFYVGSLLLVIDYAFEHILIYHDQIIYNVNFSYGIVSLSFFEGGVIISGFTILIGRRFGMDGSQEERTIEEVSQIRGGEGTLGSGVRNAEG